LLIFVRKTKTAKIKCSEIIAIAKCVNGHNTHKNGRGRISCATTGGQYV